MKRITALLIPLGTIVLFVLAFRDFFTSSMLAYGDLAPFPETAGQALSAYFSAWQPIGRGSSLPYSLVLLEEGLLVGFTGGDPSLAQKLYYLIPIPLSFISMYYFLGRMTTSKVGKWIASFVYAVNPVTIGIFIGGAMGMLYVNAIAPPLIARFLDIVRGRNLMRNAILFTFLLVLGASFGSYIVLYLVPFFVFSFGKLLSGRNVRLLAQRTMILVLCVAGFSLLILPTALYQFPIYSRFLPGGLGGIPTSQSSAILANTVASTYATSTVLQTLKFGSTSLWYLGYTGRAWWTTLGFVYPAIAFSALVLTKPRWRMHSLGFSSLAIVIISFLWATQTGVGLAFFRYAPALYVFSNPGGPNLFLIFAYVPLICISLERLRFSREPLKAPSCLNSFQTIRARKRKVRAFQTKLIIVSIFIILSTFSYSWPFFTGEMGFTSAGRSLSVSEVQPVFQKVAQWFATYDNSLDYRTLWLPLDYQTQLSLRWLDQNTLTLPLGIDQYIDVPISRDIGWIFSSICLGETARLGEVLSQLAVKYVVVNLDSSSGGSCQSTGFLGYSTPFISGSPKDFVSFLGKQQDLQQVGESSDFLIFKNMAFAGAVNGSNSLFYILPTNEASSPNNPSFSDLQLFDTLTSLPGFDARKQSILLGDALGESERAMLYDTSSIVVVPETYDVQNGNLSLQDKSAFLTLPQVEFSLDLERYSHFIDVSGWNAASGTWFISGNSLSQNSSFPDRAVITSGNLAWSNYSIETTVMFPQSINIGQGAAVILRVQDNQSFYEVWIHDRQVEMRLRGEAVDSQIAVNRTTAPIRAGTWHDLRITADGSNFQTYLDGERVLSAIDSTYATGRVGLSTYQSSAFFASFQVAAPQLLLLAPINDNYTLMAEGSHASAISSNGKVISLTEIGSTGWYRSSPFLLQKGIHMMNLTYDGSIIGSHLILYASPGNATIEEVLHESVDSSLSYVKVDDTQYKASVGSIKPSVLFLSEPYDESWTAFSGSHKLLHFKSALGLNAYYLTSSDGNEISISYAQQPLKNFSLEISGASWLAAFVLFAISLNIPVIIGKRLRRIYQKTL
jgi:hypothetical protein